jgi:4-hydroxybenzoyl-CoA reductase subunit alpha
MKTNGKETNGARLKVIGKPFRKVDARSKCVGETRFADDISLPRMLYCKILRSPEPHARIKSIDTSKALALPGVHAVITGKDLPITYGILPVSQDEHPLCVERVRFIGDPVAAVAAVDEDTAFDAMNLIEVVYEKLQSITSIEEAVLVEEPRIHDYGDGGNVHKKVHLEFGDLDQGFAEADLVREDIFFYEGNTHLPMEQHAALAHFDSDDKLTLWSSTQTPHYVHRALAKTLELPAAHIRVIATPNGGGFGGKSDPFNHEIVVAKLSMMTRRPVKVTLTREEVFYCHRGRHPVLMRSRIGVKKDGQITALDFESLLDGGAYGSYGVASTFYTGALQTVTYEVPRYRFRGLRAFTNKPPCGPKRGHGTPQPRFGLEIQLDKIADGQLSPPRLDGSRPLHRKGRQRLRLEEQAPQAALRQRRGAGVQLLHLRRGPAHLLEQHAALGRAAPARPAGRRLRPVRLDRHRARVGFRARLRRRRNPRHRPLRHPRRHRRHRLDAG